MTRGRDRVKRRLKASLGRVDRRFTNDPDWSIGVLAGPTPERLAPVPGVTNPIIGPGGPAAALKGAPAGFVADPFGLWVDGRWYLFYEVMDLWHRRGRIALSTSVDLRTWDHHGTVLAEPFHLSYPHVLRYRDDIYMVPEAWESGAVRLYRADPFPDRWIHVADLVRGPVLLDPTPFATASGWWMFVDTDPGAMAGRLELLRAPELPGPWDRHPRSPLSDGDPANSRPAGPVVRWGEHLVRTAQDCSSRYGDAVNAMRIDVLDGTRYEESVLAQPLLRGGGAGWNATSMHHCDLHRHGDGWIAFVDGHRSA